MSKQATVSISNELRDLKELVSKSSSSWWHKALVSLLAANVTLLLTVGWSIVTDHFEVKYLSSTTKDIGNQVGVHEKRIGSLENTTAIHDVLIKRDKEKR